LLWGIEDIKIIKELKDWICAKKFKNLECPLTLIP
jgi:hypothetical protein